jgi:hypothetical protein
LRGGRRHSPGVLRSIIMQSLFCRQKARAAPEAVSGWERDKKGERGVRMSLHDCGMVDVGVVVDGAAVVEQKGIGDMGPKRR